MNEEYRRQAKENSEFVIEALSEVRSNKSVENYDFLEEIEEPHKKESSPINDGLANYLTNLAIGEEVEDELVSELDRILDHSSKKGSHSRSRFYNMVQNSEGRSGGKKSLEDNEVNGHRRVIGQIEDLYRAWEEKDEFQQLLQNNNLLTYYSNEGSSNSSKNPEQLDGGEITMAVQQKTTEIAEYVADIKEMAEDGQYDEDDLDQLASKAERIQRNAGEVLERYEEVADTAEEYEEMTQELEAALIAADDVVGRAAEGIQGAYHEIEGRIEEARETFDEYVDDINGYLDEIDSAQREVLESDMPGEPEVSDDAQEIATELTEDIVAMIEFEEAMDRLSSDSE